MEIGLASYAALTRVVRAQKTIVFFRSKRQAHRATILFGLSNLNAAELHGVCVIYHTCMMIWVGVELRPPPRAEPPLSPYRGLCSALLCSADLAGNLTQLQRLEALEAFRDGKVRPLFFAQSARIPATPVHQHWHLKE